MKLHTHNIFTIKEKHQEIVIKFAGDSGDGMQLAGNEFTNIRALAGNDVATFPDFPAEIRAPAGTLAGVSGFQLHFGSREINTPGDSYDVLVALNAAALKSNVQDLKPGGVLILDTSGFDGKHLRLAKMESNPLEDEEYLSKFKTYKIDITKLTREALKDSNIDERSKDRSRNMFVLGFVCWLFDRPIDHSSHFLKEKFAGKEEVIIANIQVLKSGYNFGETTESFSTQIQVDAANLPKGTYRNIIGNKATAIGLIAAAHKSNLLLHYASYPITPASEILHELARYKNYNVQTFQAEDEIAAVCSAIGSSYGGALGVCATSGPGAVLKAEAIGLAVMLELPLVVCNIQRAGPSTGMPTKTEQADLLQSLYGRNAEAPLPVVAAASPSDSFRMVFEACRIALQHMTPVIFLSDAYNANGSEPWRFPNADDLPDIQLPLAKDVTGFKPYERDERLVRKWAVPGSAGFEHRIGGLEKDHDTGEVSYDPGNHEKMVYTRQEKIMKIKEYIPEIEIDSGNTAGDLLILGWGSTYGAIKSAVRDLNFDGYKTGHAHLKYLNPFPKNLEKLMASFNKVLIPEMNTGQLAKLIRSEFLRDVEQLNKIKGIPLTKLEIEEKAKDILKGS